MKDKNVLGPATSSTSEFGFVLESSGIEKGYIKEKYGKHGEEFLNGMPSRSFPLSWRGAPKSTKCYALVAEDYDAIPVAGFSWIHWVALIPGDLNELEENASLTNREIVQGVNSWGSSMGGLSKAEASHFGGPAPPDKEHTYTIKLYALDKRIDLKNGFSLNELYEEMKGHVLDKVVLEGKYKS